MGKRRKPYVAALEQRLESFYIAIRDYDKTDAEAQQCIRAFMEAGLLLEATSQEELVKLIDGQHQAVFGMSLIERRESEKAAMFSEGDYSVFDAPAWQRQDVKIPDLS